MDGPRYVDAAHFRAGQRGVKARTRRLLLDWHLYLGLLCAPYFVLYGVSAIAFNHHIQGEPVTSQWERTLAQPPVGKNDVAVARAARDALGFGGHALPWTVKREADGTLGFRVTRPGRVYKVALAPGGRHARVEETTRGWVGVARDMHGALSVSGISWMRLWGLYTDASIVALFFAVVSGLWLWWPRRPNRRLGIAAIGSGTFVWIGIWSWLW